MTGVFGTGYAAAYDALYADKDYGAECDVFERLAAELLDRRPVRVLDIGCGTGGHAAELARRGLEVVGVDLAPAMLERARERAQAAGVEIELVEGDARSTRLEGEFDVTLMTFALLGYQLGNGDVLAALRNAAAHTRPGGIVLFDVWYGPAVLAIRPSERVKSVRAADGAEIVRTASTELDTATHTALVRYHVRRVGPDGSTEETSEDHRVRFFFPLELELFLDDAGLDLIRIGDFEDFERDPDESTWNVLVAARRRG